MEVLTIFGTRPEALKLAPVIKQLKNRDKISVHVCVTAQHREMLDQVLELFHIKPDYDLNIMQAGQALSELTARLFVELSPILNEIKPDWVLVQGDTTTVMAASVLAYYHRIKVGHVEAGLRTGDKWQPFPEEVNRRIAGIIADLHFAPTEVAYKNLMREGVAKSNIVVTGNTIIDTFMDVVNRPYDYKVGPLAEIDFKKKIILVTVHRRENFGVRLENICNAIASLANLYGDDILFIYPVHLNPNVQGPVNRILQNIPNIILLPPLEYQHMVHLMRSASLILTDSGGIQEEAPSLGIPVLILRDKTERPEGVEAGCAKLVGTDIGPIFDAVTYLLENKIAFQKMVDVKNPYGDGNASNRIVEALLKR
jgi:UDP-N-acetylglucosamine 2-epimerase (non-hydrolysing)